MRMARVSSLVFLLFFAALPVAVQSQRLLYPPFPPALVAQDAAPFSRYDAGLFTPLEDLNAISVSEFTTLEHPAFPRHRVRVRKSRFCDKSVRAYTGYIDVGPRHLFFYFFESRRNPDTDDVIFWTNGGPGSSSSLGLFMELGPCRATSGNTTEPFKYSWNNHANIFFIDQPAGVGFSYAEHGGPVSNTMDAAQDVAAFVAIFFEHFTRFKGRALHMAGESYAGRYLPVFASTIYDQNARLIDQGLTPINLESVMIGNGGTDFPGMIASWYEAQCADPLFPPVENIATCVHLKQLVPRCLKRMKASCVDIFDDIDCEAAVNFCWEGLGSKYVGSQETLNPYDRARPCKGQNPLDCYPEQRDIISYLSREDVQDLLGVDPPARGTFDLSSSDVNLAFMRTLDPYRFPATFYLAALLERGVRALIYVGSNDWVSNWIANERMTLDLEWTANGAFREQPLREWSVDGKPAGLTRSGGGLTYATITGAGHLAPYDKPVQALALANRWLAEEEL